MKVLVLVDSVGDVPPRHRASLIIVSPANWQDIIASSYAGDCYMYWDSATPIERLLKFVEDYSGNLAVYTNLYSIGAVMESRFDTLKNRVAPDIDSAFGGDSELEKTLSFIKGAL